MSARHVPETTALPLPSDLCNDLRRLFALVNDFGGVVPASTDVATLGEMERVLRTAHREIERVLGVARGTRVPLCPDDHHVNRVALDASRRDPA